VCKQNFFAIFVFFPAHNIIILFEDPCLKVFISAEDTLAVGVERRNLRSTDFKFATFYST
jgi:hypothetical protein